MTDETENLMLSILRDIRGEQREMKERLDAISFDLCATKEEMNTRFDQVADLMTVVVSAQADLTHRVEDLEEAR